MRRISTRTFVLIGIAVALVLAFAISPLASSEPDGLEKVATEKGIDAGMTDHAVAGSPLADYSVQGVDDSSLSTGLAGVVGVAATFAIGAGLFGVIRWNRNRRGAEPSSTDVRLTSAAAP